jgi:hypothetical protein
VHPLASPITRAPRDAADDGGLAALLELFSAEEAPARETSPLLLLGSRLGPWAQRWSRRAASWGAVPELTARPARATSVEVP